MWTVKPQRGQLFLARKHLKIGYKTGFILRGLDLGQIVFLKDGSAYIFAKLSPEFEQIFSSYGKT